MFWSKKENKTGLPDLPQSNTTITKPMLESPLQTRNYRSSGLKPDFDDEPDLDERHSLPSFPDSPMKKGFSQAAIKDAVKASKEDEALLPELPETESIPIDRDKKFRTIEMEEWTPSKQSEPLIHETIIPPPITAPTIIESEKIFPRSDSHGLDIFVKIDKFRSARKTLEEIRLHIEEIDELLKKIRETRLREEQELTSWEKEIANIKSRVQNVTENIFEKEET